MLILDDWKLKWTVYIYFKMGFLFILFQYKEGDLCPVHDDIPIALMVPGQVYFVLSIVTATSLCL